MQRPESYWLSSADAAARIPNPMYASNADGAYPGGASGRRGVCSFLRARRSCLAAGIAVLLSLGVVGLAPLTFSNKQEISQLLTTVTRDQDNMQKLFITVDALKRDQDGMRQLSTTVDALKRDLDRERSRTTALEQRIQGRTLNTCPEGYTMWRAICYKAFNTPRYFNGAEEACGEDGGTLAMPRDAETSVFLVSLYKSVSSRNFFWIGLHDRRIEGKFEWVDGSALGSYNSWEPGQPENFKGIQDCVIYHAYAVTCLKDTWNDQDCHSSNDFICQVAPASCPEGHTMWRGICYKVFSTPKTFSYAAAACRADGGTLVMPRDAKTNAFLNSLYKSVQHGRGFWIGLYYRPEEGQFEWVDGSALGLYSFWGEGQPNHRGGKKRCVVTAKLMHERDRWSDRPCSDWYCFICQASPGRA
ncbi:PREDICTED: C-type mannose receptor 2-like [Branchiostoma belcheri]|uniref:C-type mannose receptor 2-like n=1 Tax=Branchiostoma belcheri TaxID=7741 RepID=A0A6P4YVI7_BRABE|nr:PREDICTED: C-type mannose receptor 2-like [Branchiostoma belcheri]